MHFVEMAELPIVNGNGNGNDKFCMVHISRDHRSFATSSTTS